VKKIVSKPSIEEIEKIVLLMDELFEQVYEAFVNQRLSLKYEHSAGDIPRNLRQGLVKLYEGTTGSITAAEALSLQSTAINFSKIYYNLLRVSSLVETKVKNKILFSESATGEINELIRRCKELLPHVGDILVTKNSVVVAHVEKEIDLLCKIALNNANIHEDRLCTGVCHPKASIIYMQLLQLVKDILWHYKALISEKDGVPNITETT